MGCGFIVISPVVVIIIIVGPRKLPLQFGQSCVRLEYEVFSIVFVVVDIDAVVIDFNADFVMVVGCC